jgi:hypothetical protein
VSFLLELEIHGLTDAQGRAVEGRCRAEKAWPVGFRPRHRRRLALFGPREVEPVLSLPDRLDDDHELLSDEASWDAPAWAMVPELLPSFAAAIRILGQELPQGFVLRATWEGSEVRHEKVLDAEALADLALASQLNEFTRYRVPAGPTRR